MRSYVQLRRILFVFTILLLALMSMPISAVAQDANGYISGTVEDEQGNPIANIYVSAMDYTTNQVVWPAANTDQYGSYTLVVPAGTYLVRAWPSWSNGLLPYADEWYNETYYHYKAYPVSVADGQTIANINFNLAPGGTISGHVYEEDGTTPIPNVSVNAQASDIGIGATTDLNGEYIIAGLHFGAYQVSAPAPPRFGSGDDSYVIQYYNNKNILTPTLVPISSTDNLADGINFNLVKGTWRISGMVTDAVGQLITNYYGCVVIMDTTVPLPQYVQIGNINTDGMGHYVIYGNSVGDYRLQALVPDYEIQWHNEGNTIPVGPGDDITINFSLNYGAGSISGKVLRADGVTPLPNGVVLAYDAATGTGAGGALSSTNTNGEYWIEGLPQGNYKIRVMNNDLIEWYKDTLSPEEATDVPVYSLQDTTVENIKFDPWLLAPTTPGGVKTGTVTEGTDYTVDAKTEADTEVDVTGTAVVTAAEYANNPGTGFEGDIGKYIDVHVDEIDETTPVTEVQVRMYYTDTEIAGKIESSLRLYWWDDTLGWVPCSESGVNTDAVDGYSGYIWANIRADITPDLSYLSGGPFGAGGSSGAISVGGIVEFPVGGSGSSSPPYSVIIGGAMAALATLAVGGWFAKRRWLRRYS